MTITLDNELATELAEIFDQATPGNKTNKAILIFKARSTEDYNFWPKLAQQFRDRVKIDEDEEEHRKTMLELQHRAWYGNGPECKIIPPVHDKESEKEKGTEEAVEDTNQEESEVSSQDVVVEVHTDRSVGEDKPEFTLKRTRRKRM